MAIKASASITLSAVVDVASVTRYYLLQASTLNKPSVPTTNPPGSSWDDTEPAYTDGSTNSLYFVDLTVFSDSSFSYSAVSLSSSYEAAKAAYNKAVAAQSSATQVASRVTAVEQKVTDSSIENVVKKSTTYKNLEGRVTSTESNISTVSQTADKINWIVSSDATSSSVKLTDTAYEVIADNIDLSANSTVKISSADQIDVSAINALNLSSNGTITLMAGNITSATNTANDAASTANAAKDDAQAAVNSSTEALNRSNSSVASVVTWYYDSTSATTRTGGSWVTATPTWREGHYIWSKTITTSYDGNTVTESDPVCITGNTGTTGNGVSSTAITYQASTSNTTAPTGTWQSTPPSVAEGSYLWTKMVLTYTNGNTSDPIYSVAKQGKTGATGTAGGKWYSGTGITGVLTTANIFSSSGVSSAVVGDMYLNTSTYNTYRCTTAGAASVAKWVYVNNIKGATGATGATGAPGIDYSQGEMLYVDPLFNEGTNNVIVYNNSGNGNVTITRTAKSSDNPFEDATYELTIANVGSSSPSVGGFAFGNISRANAIFVYRFVAKIPSDRHVQFASNSAGGVYDGTWYTSNAGTGKFQEYIYYIKCGDNGSYSTTGYFYLDGAVGTASSPVKWYLAYATCFDMTGVSDVISLGKIASNASLKAKDANDLAENAIKAAGDNAKDLARVVRIVSAEDGAEKGYPYGYLEVGDNQTNASVRITSTSIDLCLEDQAVATYAQDYIRLKNMQIRVPDEPGGLVFSFYEG